MHSVIARRDCAWHIPMPRGSFVDAAVAGPAGLGDGIVLCHVRCHVDGAKIGHMIGRIIRLVFTDGDAVAAALLLAFSMVSAARRSAVPLACMTVNRPGVPTPIGELSY
jgi:hypothetical protein